MLVKVSRKYCGTLGVFNKDIGSVVQKDNASAPFELDDALALVHIDKGILVKADAVEDVQPVKAPEKKEEYKPVEVPQEPSDADIPDELPGEDPDGIPEDNPADEDDLDSITDYKVLKQLAKEAGVNPIGKTKDELKEAIREAKA